MTVAGLWHGASWNFIIWGSINGTILYAEKLIIPLKIKLPKIIKIIFTCFIIFNLWIVFRITNFENLMIYFENLYLEKINFKDLGLIFAFIVLVTCVYIQKLDNYFSIERYSLKLNFKIFIPVFTTIILTGLLLNTGSSEKFIYFDF